MGYVVVRGNNGGKMVRVGAGTSSKIELCLRIWRVLRLDAKPTHNVAQRSARRFVPIIVPLKSHGERRNTMRGGSVETRISRVAAYVWRVTAMPVERLSLPCQGLHNGTFLPYGSSHEAQLAAACPSIASEGPSPCRRPAGRTNARTADHAWAWLQEMDRLETARNRGEHSHHRFCGHDPGPHPQRCRYRRDPDRADRNTAAPHRARRAVRGRRVLHAYVL